MNKEEWLKKGPVTESVDESIDLRAEIDRLRKEKNAVILGPTTSRVKFKISLILLVIVWHWHNGLLRQMPISL